MFFWNKKKSGQKAQQELRSTLFGLEDRNDNDSEHNTSEFSAKPRANQAIKEEKAIEMATIIRILEHQVFKGKSGKWAHVIFDAKNYPDNDERDTAIKQLSENLKKLGLVQDAPKINRAEEPFQQYQKDTLFIRIHPSSYTSIATKYTLPTFDALKNYGVAVVVAAQNISP